MAFTLDVIIQTHVNTAIHTSEELLYIKIQHCVIWRHFLGVLRDNTSFKSDIMLMLLHSELHSSRIFT